MGKMMGVSGLATYLVSSLRSFSGVNGEGEAKYE